MICWLHLRSVDYITRRRKRYATVGELVETTFASQHRYTDACFVAHLRHCSASVNPLPPDPGQWENDIDVIRIKGFADVQTISVSAIKKLTAYANGAQVPQLHQRKNQVWKIIGPAHPVGTAARDKLQQTQSRLSSRGLY